MDVDVTEIGRNYRVDLGIVADARSFLRRLWRRAQRAAGSARPPRMASANRRLEASVAGLRAAELRMRHVAVAA